MKRYAILDNSASRKEVGYYPQISSLPSNYLEAGERSIYKVPHSDFPEFTPDLSGLPLRKDAKLTDVISCAYISDGFLVNSRALEVFEEFKLPPYRLHPCTIVQNKLEYEYYWFHYLIDLTAYINFPLSDFYIGFDILSVEGPIAFQDYEDFINKYEEYRVNGKPISARKIVWKKDFPELDLFTISKVDIRTFISPSLVNMLKKNRVSGIEITEEPKSIEFVW